MNIIAKLKQNFNETELITSIKKTKKDIELCKIKLKILEKELEDLISILADINKNAPEENNDF